MKTVMEAYYVELVPVLGLVVGENLGNACIDKKS